MKGDTHKGELDILKRLDALEAEVFGKIRQIGDVIYCLPGDVPEGLKGLGHFWRYPNSDANITGYYICDNCGVCCNELGAKQRCTNPTSYSKGGK